jgi:hypothetical protein
VDAALTRNRKLEDHGIRPNVRREEKGTDRDEDRSNRADASWRDLLLELPRPRGVRLAPAPTDGASQRVIASACLDSLSSSRARDGPD